MKRQWPVASCQRVDDLTVFPVYWLIHRKPEISDPFFSTIRVIGGYRFIFGAVAHGSYGASDDV